ncbi:hypothetical protein BDZ97DRAFT_1655914 [Flammula alnicola]|nr:hypothetical protein BDZ97DRAFT_1655914 [Flammula alnicola]
MQSLPSSVHQERITRLWVSSVGDSPPSATFPISCETRISMNLCGEVITYDLQGLESDARVITELLKITKSERANYLVAAAFYRRSGNPSGAKAVLTSMVEEFTAQGVPAEQLKPAFLFLSGCELDLAKFAKAENKVSSVISGHYAAAQTCLQKVFGKAEPLRAQVHVKENIQPQLRQEDCAASKNRTESRVATTSPSVREIKKMEREIQSLRDRNAHQESQISRLRSTKRKLEDDCAYERNLRRKYQRQLDDMEKDRDAARRMEKFALDQVKRQVSERCKAEE